MTNNFWFFWEKYFSKSDIEKINSLFDERGVAENTQNHAVTPNKCLKSVSTVKKVSWQFCEPLLRKIDEEVILTNRLNHGYHLDANSSNNWVLHNTYEQTNNYDWHQDGSNDTRFDLKFTVLINTSLESYEGGELQIFQQGGAQTVKHLNTSGSVVMFKSDIPHRVTAVTKGKRNSVVYWKEGPRFV